MQGIFQKENTDKALKYGIYRHLPTYEKIIRNLVSFLFEKLTREECEAIREADGYEQGFEQGEASGFEKGKLDEKRKIALNMKAAGEPIKKIVAYSGLTEAEIKALTHDDNFDPDEPGKPI